MGWWKLNPKYITAPISAAMGHTLCAEATGQGALQPRDECVRSAIAGA